MSSWRTIKGLEVCSSELVSLVGNGFIPHNDIRELRQILILIEQMRSKIIKREADTIGWCSLGSCDE